MIWRIRKMFASAQVSLKIQTRKVLRKCQETSRMHSFCSLPKMPRLRRRAPCRRRIGEALPRAEKFGDLIEVDHKVLNEECESGICYSMDSVSYV